MPKSPSMFRNYCGPEDLSHLSRGDLVSIATGSNGISTRGIFLEHVEKGDRSKIIVLTLVDLNSSTQEEKFKKKKYYSYVHMSHRVTRCGVNDFHKDVQEKVLNKQREIRDKDIRS